MVHGMGKITIDNSDETVVTLSDVRYIPEMGRNLISYAQLERSGCTYTGKDYQVEFYKGGKRVFDLFVALLILNVCGLQLDAKLLNISR